MTSEGNRKLVQYSLAAAALLLACKNAHSQIVYTNPEPDNFASGSNAGLYVDLDNDGENEALLYVETETYFYVSSYGDDIRIEENKILADVIDTNKLLGGVAGHYFFDYGPFDLKTDYIISENKSWLFDSELILNQVNYWNSNGGTMHVGAAYGNWWETENESHYLGVKFRSDGKVYYGWVRLRVMHTDMSITIFDYAYNAQPGALIRAGEKASYFQELQVLQKGNSLIVFMPEYFRGNEIMVEVINTAGQVLLNQTSEPSDYLSIYTASVPPGVYIIKVTDGSLTRTKKVVFEG